MTTSPGVDGRGAGGDVPRTGSSSPSALSQLAGFAADVGAVAGRLPALPRTAALRNELMVAAESMRSHAGQAVTIGVVGEFSAGKSLLLGLLLGKPDLLPVSDDPTTANVTALQLTQGPVDAPRRSSRRRSTTSPRST